MNSPNRMRLNSLSSPISTCCSSTDFFFESQACSALRRRRLISWLPLAFGGHISTPAPDHSSIETARVEAALARIPVQQRAPLLLHLVVGFSYAEVATLLQVSEGTVRMRISRGRAAFRAAYGGEEDDDAS